MRSASTFAALLLLAGCTAPAVPEGQRIDGIDWILVDMNGLPWGQDATLRIDGDRLTGIGPCNAYSGAQAASPPGFAARAIAATALPCADLDRNRAEREYLDQLGRAEAMRRDRARLVLSGPGVEMVFAKREARGDEVF